MGTDADIQTAAAEDQSFASSPAPIFRSSEEETRPGPGAGRCIHELFEEQVSRTPDAIAVVFEDRQWTYRELNDRASRVARELQARGVGPEVRVGICVKRSLEMMVGLLAILKAGGAYVPIDPVYPKDRIAFVLEDADVPVLLTQTELLPSLPPHHAEAICLSAESPHSGFPTPHSPLRTPHSPAPQPSTLNPQPRDLAYVLYTSGSTGRPKGVMICHRNVVNFFDAMDAVIGRHPGTWLAVTSISFDISVLELFWTLTRGFKVIVHGDEWHNASAFATGGNGRPHRSIADQIITHDVTHLQCTPSQAALLAEDSRSLNAMRRLRKFLLGGEALPPALVRRLEGCGELFNMYGPTETTIWSTAARISNPDSITIGRPIANTQIYVVDENLQPVPPGEPGELLIGGAGVARGYLNRPELTAEKFVENPAGFGTRSVGDKRSPSPRPSPPGEGEAIRASDLSESVAARSPHSLNEQNAITGTNGSQLSEGKSTPPSPGGPQFAERTSPPGEPTGGGLGKPLGRGEGEPSSDLIESTDSTNTQRWSSALLYRSGDLVRLRPDGELEYLGRIDHQLKLRGHRIELGEIESVIGQHPAVRQNVVVAREDQPGDKRLVAYVVPRAAAATDLSQQLRQHVKEKLPEIMVPAAFVFLSELPLTPNGKIDRKALPPGAELPIRESQIQSSAQRDSRVPTDLESRVASIWQDVLRVEHVGLNDNFFDLGGHSLLLAEVHARLREAFGIDLPIIKLFQYTTVHSLAQFLGEGMKEKISLAAVTDRAQKQRAAFAARPSTRSTRPTASTPAPRPETTSTHQTPA